MSSPINTDRRPYRLQPLARTKLASLGAEGEQWYAELPALVRRLERQWSVTVTRGLPGGSTSYVALAERPDSAGEPLVIKIGIPGYDLAPEAAALAAGGGEGYARLHAYDEPGRALLMERLGDSMERSGREPEEQLAVLGRVLTHVWRRPLSAADRAAAAEPAKATGLAAMIIEGWRSSGRPCPQAVVDQALRYADQLAAAHDPQRCVWVHGDPHPGNLLACAPRPGAPDGYVLTDPDPFVDDPCYDLGVALRDWAGRLAGPDPVGWLRARCATLAAATGQDADTVWRWAYLERVSTGMYVYGFGAERLGLTFLDTAARLLDD